MATEGEAEHSEPRVLIVAACFPMGRVVATPSSLDAISNAGQVPEELLGHHCTCDWGDLSELDWAQNNFALKAQERLFSAYHLADGYCCKWACACLIVRPAGSPGIAIVPPPDYGQHANALRCQPCLTRLSSPDKAETDPGFGNANLCR